jgi:hypothetical protein
MSIHAQPAAPAGLRILVLVQSSLSVFAESITLGSVCCMVTKAWLSQTGANQARFIVACNSTHPEDPLLASSVLLQVLPGTNTSALQQPAYEFVCSKYTSMPSMIEILVNRTE